MRYGYDCLNPDLELKENDLVWCPMISVYIYMSPVRQPRVKVHSYGNWLGFKPYISLYQNDSGSSHE